jgi:hypothetical protein
MTVQTTTDEKFEAQLRADDQNALWLSMRRMGGISSRLRCKTADAS